MPAWYVLNDLRRVEESVSSAAACCPHLLHATPRLGTPGRSSRLTDTNPTKQDRDVSTLSRGVSTPSQASLGDADDSVLHFEHTFQARLLVPTHATDTAAGAVAAAAAAEGSAEADAETAALLNLPMPRAAGPGAPPTHHAYPQGHPHHLQAHQLGPPLHSSPAPAAAYKEVPVRITLVGEKLTVEEDSGVVLGRAKPPPVLAASFPEVRAVDRFFYAGWMK